MGIVSVPALELSGEVVGVVPVSPLLEVFPFSVDTVVVDVGLVTTVSPLELFEQEILAVSSAMNKNTQIFYISY